MNGRDKNDFLFIFAMFNASLERKVYNTILSIMGPLTVLIVDDSNVLSLTDNLIIDFILSIIIWEIPFVIGVPGITTFIVVFLTWTQYSTNKMVHMHVNTNKRDDKDEQ